MEMRGRELPDFGPTCWWQSVSPDSHFTRKTICTRLDGDGRITVSGRTFIETRNNSRTHHELDTDEDLLATYRDRFRISLPRPPAPVTGR